MIEENLNFEKLEEAGLLNVRDRVEEIPIEEIEGFFHSDLDLTDDSNQE